MVKEPNKKPYINSRSSTGRVRRFEVAMLFQRSSQIACRNTVIFSHTCGKTLFDSRGCPKLVVHNTISPRLNSTVAVKRL